MGSTTVAIGPFNVCALPTSALVDSVSDLAIAPRTVKTAFALHVGGLAVRNDEEVRAAYDAADVVYADGTSISLVSRFTAGTWVDRSSTTDIGIPVLQSIAKKLGRPVRVSLVGGPDGLARTAAVRLADQPQVDVVFATHGFHDGWDGVIADLHASDPDVVVVGMGCPQEMLWVHRLRPMLPPALYLTCGGWFGFLTGAERRAPAAMQRAGLEWLFRVAQDHRKVARYLRGFGDVTAMIREGRRGRGSPLNQGS